MVSVLVVSEQAVLGGRFAGVDTLHVPSSADRRLVRMVVPLRPPAFSLEGTTRIGQIEPFQVAQCASAMRTCRRRRSAPRKFLV